MGGRARQGNGEKHGKCCMVLFVSLTRRICPSTAICWHESRRGCPWGGAGTKDCKVARWEHAQSTTISISTTLQRNPLFSILRKQFLIEHTIVSEHSPAPEYRPQKTLSSSQCLEKILSHSVCPVLSNHLPGISPPLLSFESFLFPPLKTEVLCLL